MKFEDTYALELFYEILRIRRIEEAILEHYPHQKIRSPIHLSIGQEVSAVAVCKQLTKEDQLVSNYRPHAHYLAKGGNLNKLIAELYGKETGCTSGRGGSLHLADLNVGFYGSAPIVASTIPIGVGLAFASFLKKESYLTSIFFEGEATEEGVFTESLYFAALKKLPVLFVCENNFHSVYPPSEDHQIANRNCVKLAQAHGIYTKCGDGSNLEETYVIATKAIDHIRNGNGPAYIELKTYQLREHCATQSESERDYCPKDKIGSRKQKCPLKIYQDHLTKRNILSAEKMKEIEGEVTAEIDSAFSFAEKSPFPEFDFDDEHVFAR